MLYTNRLILTNFVDHIKVLILGDLSVNPFFFFLYLCFLCALGGWIHVSVCICGFQRNPILDNGVIEIYSATAIRTSVIYQAFRNGCCHAVSKCVKLKLHRKKVTILNMLRPLYPPACFYLMCGAIIVFNERKNKAGLCHLP